MTNIKGIDVSVWQGKNFDFKKAKAAGYDFVIMRASGTGYGGDGTTKYIDTNFKAYYKAAKAAGLNVGAYHYSCANTKAKGIAEAEYIYKNCLKGRQFEYPIFIDVENVQWQTKDKKGVTDAIIGFCDTLENKGYFVGVYASLYWFKTYIQNSRINRYLRWVACWQTKKPVTTFKYGIWQYTSKLTIDGVNVDGDISYTDYAKVIKNAGLNGFTKETVAEPEPEPVPEPVPEPEPQPDPVPDPVVPTHRTLNLNPGDSLKIMVGDCMISMERKKEE